METQADTPEELQETPPSGRQSQGFVAGMVTGLGLVIMAVGCYSLAVLWRASDSYADAFNNGFSGGNPVSGGADFASIQRWDSVNSSMMVIGVGLAVVALGLVLRRLDQR